MKKSVWSGKKLPKFEKLQGSVKTDVLIVGGGLCGLLCAYFLKERGIDYILAEANTIAYGVTENTTAKITFLHTLIYSKLINSEGFEKAKMYLEANRAALSEYEKLCQKIDCDFEKKNAYTYSLTNRRELENEAEALKRLGADAEFTQTTELPFETVGAVKLKNQAQFNPLKFIYEISKGLNIYEHTFVKDITDHTASGNGFKITAKKIILATHFPFVNMHGMYFLKLYQHRSYAAALSGAGSIDGMYVDSSDTGMSFRQYKDMLIIGGGGHKTGKHGGGFGELTAFAENYFPKAEIKYMWATQDCMSLDSVPYIGQYSKSTPDFYVATGFNKWGMTSSMAAAMILSDMVTGKENGNAAVFNPSRSMIKPQLFLNAVNATVNLLTPTVPRCPHMGCALKWNKAEHTWDCPCHGSRFEEDGRLISNPALKNAKTPR